MQFACLLCVCIHIYSVCVWRREGLTAFSVAYLILFECLSHEKSQFFPEDGQLCCTILSALPSQSVSEVYHWGHMYTQTGPSGFGGGWGQIVTVDRGGPVTYIGQCKSSFRPVFSCINKYFSKPCIEHVCTDRSLWIWRWVWASCY